MQLAGKWKAKEGCGWHDFGTRILKKTGNLKLVMNTMGHVNIKTAMSEGMP